MAIIYAVVNFNKIRFKVNTNMKVYKLNWDYRNQKAKVEPYLTKQENLNNSIANKKIIEIREKFEELKLSLFNKSIDNITQMKGLRTIDCGRRKFSIMMQHHVLR